MQVLTEQQLRTAWPAAKLALIKGVIAAQHQVYSRYNLVSGLRLAHFWAQISHESGDGTELVESLNYGASRLVKIFPHHFTVKLADKYGRTPAHPANQIAIGNIAYGGRMGNRKASNPEQADDGYNFRGRGLIQTTGKYGYDTLSHLVGLDLLKHPDLIADPAHALECAGAEFAHYPGMLPACDRDDVNKVTYLINGGSNGLADRKARLVKWKKTFGL